MCCCGCALTILMEESRLASPAGAGVQHNEACQTAKAASRKQSSAWQAITHWFTSASRPRNTDTNVNTERSAVA